MELSKVNKTNSNTLLINYLHDKRIVKNHSIFFPLLAIGTGNYSPEPLYGICELNKKGLTLSYGKEY